MGAGFGDLCRSSGSNRKDQERTCKSDDSCVAHGSPIMQRARAVGNWRMFHDFTQLPTRAQHDRDLGIEAASEHALDASRQFVAPQLARLEDHVPALAISLIPRTTAKY